MFEKKINNKIYNFVILMLLGFYFIIPRTLEKESLTLEKFEIWNILLPIVLSISLLLLLIITIRKVKFTRLEVVSIIMIVIMNLTIMKTYYMLICYLISKLIIESSYKVNLKKKQIGIIIFLSLLLQMTYFRYHSNLVLSLKDPNYSSFLFLLGSFTLVRTNKFLFILSIIIGQFFGSRTYLLAIIFFFLFSFKFIKKLFKKFKMISYSKLIIFSTIIVLVVGNLFLYSVKGEEIGTYKKSVIRSLKDGSNKKRFLANNYLVKTVFYRIFSRTTDKWDENLPYPHNFIFRSIVMYGLLTTVLIIYLNNKIFKVFLSNSNINYFMPILIYLMFLGELTNLSWLIIETIIFKEFIKNSQERLSKNT